MIIEEPESGSSRPEVFFKIERRIYMRKKMSHEKPSHRITLYNAGFEP
jgi:hypothetical protein